jgi:hypothetical protein
MPIQSRNPEQGIGLAARVILHLAHFRPLGPNDIATVSRTQQGMIAALGARQNSLAKVLFILRAGDLVTVESRYVGETNRRMKVYQLTSIGESSANNLRLVSDPDPD